jgi:hypothetical protein
MQQDTSIYQVGTKPVVTSALPAAVDAGSDDLKALLILGFPTIP